MPIITVAAFRHMRIKSFHLLSDYFFLIKTLKIIKNVQQCPPETRGTKTNSNNQSDRFRDNQLYITDYRGPYRKKKLIVTDVKHTGNDFSLLRFCFSVVFQFVLLSPTRIKTKTNGAGYATSAQSSPTHTHHSNQTFYKRQSFSADGQSLQRRDVIVQRGRSRSRRRPGHYACHTEASPPGVAAGLSQCKAKPPCSPPPPPQVNKEAL